MWQKKAPPEAKYLLQELEGKDPKLTVKASKLGEKKVTKRLLDGKSAGENTSDEIRLHPKRICTDEKAISKYAEERGINGALEDNQIIKLEFGWISQISLASQSRPQLTTKKGTLRVYRNPEGKSYDKWLAKCNISSSQETTNEIIFLQVLILCLRFWVGVVTNGR